MEKFQAQMMIMWLLIMYFPLQVSAWLRTKCVSRESGKTRFVLMVLLPYILSSFSLRDRRRNLLMIFPIRRVICFRVEIVKSGKVLLMIGVLSFQNCHKLRELAFFCRKEKSSYPQILRAISLYCKTAAKGLAAMGIGGTLSSSSQSIPTNHCLRLNNHLHTYCRTSTQSRPRGAERSAP